VDERLPSLEGHQVPGQRAVARGPAARYELPFEQPDWKPDIIDRYGLSEPA
jgi:hypothetical protein